MRMVIVAVMLLMLASSIAFAADWRCFGTNDDGSVYFYDAQSLTRGKDTVKVWSRVVLGDNGKAKIIKTNPEVDGVEKVSYALTRWEIDCSKNVSRTTAISYYTSKGDVLWSDDAPDADFEQAPPNTVISALVDAICGKGEQSTTEK